MDDISLALSSGARVILGAVFVASGLAKLIDPPAFAISVRHFGCSSRIVLPLIVGLLPRVELVLGLSILLGWWVSQVTLVAAGLLIAFTVLMGQHILRGQPRADCGCFGRTGTDAWAAIARNVGLVCLTVASIYSARATTAAVLALASFLTSILISRSSGEGTEVSGRVKVVAWKREAPGNY